MAGKSEDSAEQQGKRELREDALVKALAQDPSGVLPTVVLAGHLGRSPRRGTWRLYLNDTLTEFIDIDEGDIVHSVQPAEGASAETRTRLWVSAGADLEHHRVESRRVQADFLGGEFVSGIDRSVSTMSMAGLGLGITSEPCIVTIYLTFTRCPNTLFGICSSFGGICRTPPRAPGSNSPSGCLSLNACP